MAVPINTYNSFESRFHQLLAKWIDARIREVALQLAGGELRDLSDVNATAMRQSDIVGYVRGLHDVLAQCEIVVDNLSGREKK